MDAMIRILQSWGVPVVMTGAYAVLAWSSDTTTTGKAWMAIGLAFVFVLWWLFRFLTEHAALTRAIAVGDSGRVLELTGRQLRRRKSAIARTPYLIYRALGHELRGEWDQALAAVDAARPDKMTTRARATWTLLAAAVRVGVFVETGKVEEARNILVTELSPALAALDRRLHPSAHLVGNVAIGRAMFAEGEHQAAAVTLQSVLDDIHAGAGLRAVAHVYLARIADRTDAAAAARHRAEIAKLIPDASAWVRAQ